MFISFTVENFLSIKDKLKIDFTADIIKEFKENQFLPYSTSKTYLLKTLGVYGSNGSGKSNLLKAVSFVRTMVLNSSKESNTSQPISVEPFLMSSTAKNKPSAFEIVFYISNVKYRYGFSVTSKYVESEWLFYTDKKREEKLFIRARQDFNFEKTFKAGIKGKFELFAEVTRPNTLFLSVLAQFNSTICVQISEWFSEILIAQDTAHFSLIDYTASLMSTADYREIINKIIRGTDLGIDYVEERLINSENIRGSFHDLVMSIMKDSAMSYKILTTHSEFNNEGQKSGKVLFELLKNESLGTQKFFGILGPILEALKKRKVVFIDELDARLHTLLFDTIITLFNSNKFNPNGAQLVFTAHNLQPFKKGLRRDQIILMKKDDKGSSTAGSLHETHPDVRSDASFEKDYLLGKYDAIPKLNIQMNLFDSQNEVEND